MISKTNLDSQARDISDLILSTDLRFQIPKFQRSYCWEKENIDMLWADIDSLLTDYESKRFLGAIILKEYKTPTGRNRFMIYDVIDGQQRLTTLWMLLAVIFNKTWHEASTYLASATDAETKELCNELRKASREYALKLLDRTGVPKIMPSFSDIKNFNWALEYLDFLEKDKPERFPTANSNNSVQLEIAVELISDSLKERLEKNSSPIEKLQYLDNLIENVIKRLEVIEVILADYHDPNEVFDRLNIAGQELTVLDMVRNEIFKVFSDDDKESYNFYDKEWKNLEREFEKPFEIEMSFLDEEEKKKNNVRYSKLISSHKNNFWYPYALTKNSDASGQKKQLFDGLRKYWSEIPCIKPIEKARAILKDIEKYVPIYNAITQGTKIPSLNKKQPLWGKISKIHQYNIQSGAHSYLFLIIRESIETDDKNKLNDICNCLDLIESYTIRRAFCKDDGSIKNIFNPAWEIAGTDPQLLNLQLHDSSREFYSDDQIITSLTQEKGLDFYSLRNRALYCLVEYEKSLAGDTLEYELFTIDHVMPQKYEANWGHIKKDDHDLYKNSWGNLVPLTKSINARKSNRSWADTKNIYGDESATKSPRLIAKNKDWTINDIKERNQKLAKWAIDQWKRPPVQSEYQDELDKKLDKKIISISNQLSEKGFDAYVFKISKTGHTKHNLTVTKKMDLYLKTGGFHNFEEQDIGTKNKIYKKIVFVYENHLRIHEMSLYKTSAKEEARFWPGGLSEYCMQWSILALWINNGKLYLINCTSEPIFKQTLNLGHKIAKLPCN